MQLSRINYKVLSSNIRKSNSNLQLPTLCQLRFFPLLFWNIYVEYVFKLGYIIIVKFQSYKKDLYRREGKGRRGCLGDRIYSIPCHTSYFALGWNEEKDEFHQDDMNKSLNCNRMIWRKGLLSPGWSEEKDDIVIFFKLCKIATITARNGINSVP